MWPGAHRQSSYYHKLPGSVELRNDVEPPQFPDVPFARMSSTTQGTPTASGVDDIVGRLDRVEENLVAQRERVEEILQDPDALSPKLRTQLEHVKTIMTDCLDGPLPEVRRTAAHVRQFNAEAKEMVDKTLAPMLLNHIKKQLAGVSRHGTLVTILTTVASVVVGFGLGMISPNTEEAVVRYLDARTRALEATNGVTLEKTLAPENPAAGDFLRSLGDTPLAQPSRRAWLAKETDRFLECTERRDEECLRAQRERLLHTSNADVMQLFPRVVWAQYVLAEQSPESLARAISAHEKKLEGTTADGDILLGKVLILVHQKEWSRALDVLGGLESMPGQPVMPPMNELRAKGFPIRPATYNLLADNMREFVKWQQCPVAVAVSTQTAISDTDLKRVRSWVSAVSESVLVGEPALAPANLFGTQVFAREACIERADVVASSLRRQDVSIVRFSSTEWPKRVSASDRRKIGDEWQVLVRFGDEVRAKHLVPRQ